jgi:hypothetical protein
VPFFTLILFLLSSCSCFCSCSLSLYLHLPLLLLLLLRLLLLLLLLLILFLLMVPPHPIPQAGREAGIDPGVPAAVLLQRRTRADGAGALPASRAARVAAVDRSIPTVVAVAPWLLEVEVLGS